VLFGKTLKRINLALQGGGSHGAFTWGVLDALMEDDGIEPGWISAASAGAVNAAAVASGYAKDGRAGARACLRQVWEAVEKAGVPDLMRFNPFFFGLRSAPIPNVAAFLSPYEFNPLGFDPLRRVLEGAIDFAAIRKGGPFDLLIAATDVATGRPRLFRRAELTVESVLASACLPNLHHAVEIDGRAYWDGGFSANPPIVALAAGSPTADTLIVQLNPLNRTGVPRRAGDIANQVNVITFNQPLIAEVELVVTAQELRSGWRADRRGRLAKLGAHRFHLIEAGRFTANLAADSKAKPEKALLAYLFASGRSEGQRWLARHRADIGRRPTADLKARYLERPSATRLDPQAEPNGEPGRDTGEAVG
jgi:NTE family protein